MNYITLNFFTTLFQEKDKLKKLHLFEQEKFQKGLDKEKITAKKKCEKELKKAEKKGQVEFFVIYVVTKVCLTLSGIFWPLTGKIMRQHFSQYWKKRKMGLH